MTARARLIAVDWGTTSCRASLLDARGNAIARIADAPGILGVGDRKFDEALSALVAPWRKTRGHIPIVLSGMIGSRQGWKETMYVPCPTGLTEIAASLLTVATSDLGEVRIVPGLDTSNADVPDVMRGEETQILGAGVVDGLCVLPGTHSKWAQVEGGRITRFATYMTGEIYAALRGHTILGRLMTEPRLMLEPQSPADEIAPAFLAGVRAGAAAGGPGALLHRVFSVRTLGLFERIPADALADHLSGLLIGAEIADAAHGGKRLITVIASDQLTKRYVAAAQALGLLAHGAPATCAERGAFAIAKAARLVSPVGAA
jgi:2-dehydro-3-deoxygalactonokinase